MARRNRSKGRVVCAVALAIWLLPVQVEAQQSRPQVERAKRQKVESAEQAPAQAPAQTQDPGAPAADPGEPAPPSSGKGFASTLSHGAAAAADLVFMRPLLAVASVCGLVIFVPVALISAAQGESGFKEAWEVFVAVPAENTFTRPLGEF